MVYYYIQLGQEEHIQRQLGKVTLVVALEILTRSTRDLLWCGAEWQQDNVSVVNEDRTNYGKSGWRWCMEI